MQRIPEEEWPGYVMGVVSGKARAAIPEVDPQAEYTVLKETILVRFEVTPEASRLRFRKLKYNPQEDPGDVVVLMKILARQWLIPKDGRTSDRDDIILDRVVHEQYMYMNILLKHTREWLLQQNLANVTETEGI